MLQLTPETEQLARKIAEPLGYQPEELIRYLLEQKGWDTGILDRPRRMTSAEMLAFGKEFAALPVRDPRPIQEIIDDLNAL